MQSAHMSRGYAQWYVAVKDIKILAKPFRALLMPFDLVEHLQTVNEKVFIPDAI